MIKSLFLLILVLVAAACGSSPQFADSEFPARTVNVRGTNYSYRIYVPAVRKPDEKLPVMLYLHGSGSKGSDNHTHVDGIAPLVREHPERFPFAIVFPQCRDGKFWAGEMNEMALAALDQTVKELDGDPQRLYLAGFSMGGNGTWQNGLVHAGKFAALVPIAGYVAPQGKLSDEVLASLPPKLREAAVSPDPYSFFATQLGGAAVWVFHGTKDEAVPIDESRKIMEAFHAAGKTNVRLTEYDDGHLVALRALGEPELSTWLLRQRLK